VYGQDTVSSVSATNNPGSYDVGKVITIDVIFTGAITVVTTGGTPTLTLTVGAATPTATYATGSGTTTLQFTYTVAAGDDSAGAPIDYASTTALSANGATLTDSMSMTPTLTLPTVGSASSLSSAGIIVDTTAPTFSTVSSSFADGTYGLSATVPFSVAFSEPVTFSTNPSLDLVVGSGTGTATYVSGNNTATLVFNYVPAAGDSGVVSVSDGLAGSTVTDIAGNAFTGTVTGLTPTAITIDTSAPTVSSVAATSGTYTPTQTVSITVTFSAAVNVFGAPTLALSNGASATYASGNGTTALVFTYVVGSSASEAASPLEVGSATALSGTIVAASTGNTATLTLSGTALADSTSNVVISIPTVPTVSSVTGTAGNYKLAASIPLTVTFSEAVYFTGTAPTLSLNTGNAATYTSGNSSTTFIFTYQVVSPDDQSPLSATGITGAIFSVAANTQLTQVSFTQTVTSVNVDGVVPTLDDVTATAGSYAVAATISFSVDFSESVTVAGGTPSLPLDNGGSADYVSGSGTSTLQFEYVVAVGDSGSLDVDSTSSLVLNGATIRDAFGNDATLSLSGFTVPGILVGPPPSSSVSVTDVSGSPSASTVGVGGVITITLTFNATVNVTGSPTLSLNTGGTATYSGTPGVLSTTQTFTYTVSADDDSQTALDVTSPSALSGGTIVDATGASVDVILPGSLVDSEITIDTAGPTVTGVTSSNSASAYSVGDSITIRVSWSEPTYLTAGIPSLDLVTGSDATTSVSYTDGNGTSTWTFVYEIAAGDNTDNLDYSSTTALAANGAVITDAVGNPADLTLPAPGSAGSLGDSVTIIVDTTAPTVVKVVSNSSTSTTYNTGDTINIAITFSEPVTVTGSAPKAQLTLATGANNAHEEAVYSSGSGSTVLIFKYVVVLLDSANPLDYVSNSSLSVSTGASITDAAGNSAVLRLPNPGSANSLSKSGLVVDAIPDPDFTLVITLNEQLPCSEVQNDAETVNSIVTDQFQGMDITSDYTCSAIPSKKRQDYVSFLVFTYSFYNTQPGDQDAVSNSTDVLVDKINAQVPNAQVASIDVVSNSHIVLPTFLGITILLLALLVRE